MSNNNCEVESIFSTIFKTAENAAEDAERNYNNPIASEDRPEPKYSIGERVKVSGWTGSDIGVVAGIKWVFHNRMGEYRWGYNIENYEGDGPGLSLFFIPEGYLSKLPVTVNKE